MSASRYILSSVSGVQYHATRPRSLIEIWNHSALYCINQVCCVIVSRSLYRVIVSISTVDLCNGQGTPSWQSIKGCFVFSRVSGSKKKIGQEKFHEGFSGGPLEVPNPPGVGAQQENVVVK